MTMGTVAILGLAGVIGFVIGLYVVEAAARLVGRRISEDMNNRD